MRATRRPRWIDVAGEQEIEESGIKSGRKTSRITISCNPEDMTARNSGNASALAARSCRRLSRLTPLLLLLNPS